MGLKGLTEVLKKLYPASTGVVVADVIGECVVLAEDTGAKIHAMTFLTSEAKPRKPRPPKAAAIDAPPKAKRAKKVKEVRTQLKVEASDGFGVEINVVGGILTLNLPPPPPLPVVIKHEKAEAASASAPVVKTKTGAKKEKAPLKKQKAAASTETKSLPPKKPKASTETKKSAASTEPVAKKFTSPNCVYEVWRRSKMQFLEAHPPTGQARHTFLILSSDKSWHNVPFSMKADTHKARAAQRAKTEPYPKHWEVHERGLYDPAILQKRGVTDPYQLHLDDFHSLDMQQLCNDRPMFRKFMDWLFLRACSDPDWPPYTAILWDGKRKDPVNLLAPHATRYEAGAYLVWRDGREPEYLGDNGICEADLSVPYWIDYLHTQYPVDTTARNVGLHRKPAILWDTADGDTLAILMLRYARAPCPFRVIWMQRATKCIDVTRFAEIMHKSFHSVYGAAGRANAVEAFVMALIFTGSDFWSKKWLFLGLGDVKMVDLVMRSGVFPLLPVTSDQLKRMAQVDEAKDLLPEDEPAWQRLRNGLATLVALGTPVSRKVKDSEVVKFRPDFHTRRMLRHFYYWREVDNVEFGSLFSARKSEVRAGQGLKRARSEPEPTPDSVAVCDASDEARAKAIKTTVDLLSSAV